MTEAQKKATQKYKESKAEIKLFLSPELKERTKKAAEYWGQSLNAYLIGLIESDLEAIEDIEADDGAPSEPANTTVDTLPPSEPVPPAPAASTKPPTIKRQKIKQIKEAEPLPPDIGKRIETPPPAEDATPRPKTPQPIQRKVTMARFDR